MFPESKFSKNPAPGKNKWKPVKEVLDFSDEGKSIFERKVPLSVNTLKRIYAGLIKYVAGGEKNFITQRNSGNPFSKLVSVDGPARTITKTGGNQDLITADFLIKYHGNGENILSSEDCCSTLTTKDRLALTHPIYWLDKYYNGDHNHSSINSPAGALTSVPKSYLVSAKSGWIMDTQYNNIGSSLNSPAGVITANRKHHYIMNPQWFNKGGSSVERPCPTIIARQDKAPLYLVTTNDAFGKIAFSRYDSFAMINIKEFMAVYGIIDIKMRMLKVSELLKIQGFPNDYKLVGSKTEQKKFIGNSVPPIVPEKWMEAIYQALQDMDGDYIRRAA